MKTMKHKDAACRAGLVDARYWNRKYDNTSPISPAVDDAIQDDITIVVKTKSPEKRVNTSIIQYWILVNCLYVLIMASS